MSNHQELYLSNGQLFATEFVRVVHGGRGDYVEFTFEQILLPPLKSKFGNDPNIEDFPFYYLWLYPIDSPSTKVYKQFKTVKYADYKIGMYYVAPDLFRDFKDPHKLF